MELKIDDADLPGLYQAANNSSVDEQKKYFNGIAWYLFLLIIAATFTYLAGDYPDMIYKIIACVFFLVTLTIMVWLRVCKPEDTWYNGRAVAESVKTRSWRWMMRSEPYLDNEDFEIIRKHFVNDLMIILKQNESLVGKLGNSVSIEDPISQNMIQVRKLNLSERFDFYRQHRITEQALWYSKKAKFNKLQARNWFWATVIFHSSAIILLLLNIYYPHTKLPIEVIAVAASSVLTWLQAKKHNELSSSYSLTAHEIVLIKSEVTRITTEADLSEYIMNCENAFSREHTQWFARKNE